MAHKSKKRAKSTTNKKRNHQQKMKPIVKYGFIAVGLFLGVMVVLMLVFNGDKHPKFDGELAFDQLEAQVAFGPRVPGTEAHLQTRDYLVSELNRFGMSAGVQEFSYTDQIDSSITYTGYNIIASFTPKEAAASAGRRIMLSAHWDSRPFADHDPDSTKHTEPVMGANDGASGVAVLLEMARIMKKNPPAVGVDLVLFDLEDLGSSHPTDTTAPGNPFAIGSQVFVENNPTYRPAWGILLDMVGDKNLAIRQEAYSIRYANNIVRKIWAAAEKVGATAFKNEQVGAIQDDHVAFIRAGIPVVDLIHAPFPDSWHTTFDTVENCSAESLQQVGNVIVEMVYGE